MKTTRFLIATLICVGLITAGLAEAASIPAKINYQGVLKDAAGAKVDGTVDIDLRLLPLGGGAEVFSESHAGVSVVGGLFSLKIGGVNDMSAVSFDTAYELELTVDGDLLSPNTPLCSAPYALGVVGGAQGPQGKQGADGAAGTAGTTGAAGAQGPQGKQGDDGPVGSEFWALTNSTDHPSLHENHLFNVNPTGLVAIGVDPSGPASQHPRNFTQLHILRNSVQSRASEGMIETTNESPGGNTKHWRIHNPGVVEYGVSILSNAALHISNNSLKDGPGLTLAAISGNVGIGTMNPGQRLDVSGNIQASGALVVNNGAGGNWHYRLNGSTLEWFENQVIGRVNMSLTLGGQLAVFDSIQAGGSGYKVNGNNGGAGNWDMKLGNGGDLVWYENATYGAERMRLTKSGNLGIANDNPGQMFQVAGAYCNGSVWVDVSTREAKKNIEPLSLDVALQTLTDLDPVTFEYKDAKTPDGHVGFIAEDVPEIVATPDRKGLVSMDIVGVLTAVVKEQQKQMEIMRAELTELKAIVQP